MEIPHTACSITWSNSETSLYENDQHAWFFFFPTFLVHSQTWWSLVELRRPWTPLWAAPAPLSTSCTCRGSSGTGVAAGRGRRWRSCWPAGRRACGGWWEGEGAGEVTPWGSSSCVCLPSWLTQEGLSEVRCGGHGLAGVQDVLE